ncbi:MAG TPA: hypothetical protein VGK87_15905 [Anaerolineae bacterium]|jgi:hypothetical protein
MVNKATQIERAIVLALISIAVAVGVVTIGLAVNTSVQAAAKPARAVAGEIWIPVSGTNYIVTAFSQVVANMIPPVAEPFTPTGVIFYTFDPLYPTVLTYYPAIFGMSADGGTAIVTATIPLFGTPGSRAHFDLTYLTASSPSPITTSVNYAFYRMFQTFLPTSLEQFASAGDAPCNAGAAWPMTNYTTVQDSPYKFYSLNVPITSNLMLTVTGYPLAGQMQLRTPPLTGACVQTGTQYVVAYTEIAASPVLSAFVISPGSYFVRFSPDLSATSTVPFNFRWSMSPAPNEPNNTPCTAIPIKPNTLISDYPEDTEDWFTFGLTTTSNVQISLADFAATDGQLQLKQQITTCDNASLQLIDYSGISAGGAVLPSHTLNPGRYYARVVTVAGYTWMGPYHLTVSAFPTTVANPTGLLPGATPDHTSAPLAYPFKLPKVFQLPPQP